MMRSFCSLVLFNALAWLLFASVVRRDLKSLNLLDSKGNFKISDYGLTTPEEVGANAT
jgi:hypothetical protein